MNNGQGSHFPPYFFLKIEKRIVVNCDIVQVRSCPAVEVVIHIARKWAGFMKEQFPYATAQKSRKGGQEGLGHFSQRKQYVFKKTSYQGLHKLTRDKEGTEEKSISQMRDHLFALQVNQ